MRNLIKHILKEEVPLVNTKKIKILKNFINDYFSKTDFYRGLDVEIGSWKSVMSSTPIPEIRLTIYISDEDDKVNESDFSDLIDELDFLITMLFPKDDKDRYTAVWTMDVNPI